MELRNKTVEWKMEMEQWMYTIIDTCNSCNWRCSIKVVVATMLLCIYRALISLLECAWTCPVYQHSSLFGIMMSVRKWSFPNSGSLRLATVPCMVATLTTVKTATKIMRPRSDRGVTEEVHRQISKQRDQGSSTIKYLFVHNDIL